MDEKQIAKYQELVKKRFNRDISREEALENGLKLIRLLELIYKPMTKEEYNMVEKRRKETGM